MKKILLIDHLSPEGHINYNRFWIRLLNELEINYIFVGRETFIDRLNILDNVTILKIPDSFYKNINHKNIIMREISLFKILSYIKKILDIDDYDKVIFLSFENLSFFLSFSFHKKKVYNILHNNLRRIDNKIIFKILKYLSKKINLISLDYYIQEALIKRGIYSEVIIHPLVKFNKDRELKKNKEMIIFSPSISSTDEAFIEKIIKDKEIFKIIDNKKIKLVFRSKKIKYNSNNIEIISKYLKENEYIQLLKEAEYILLPYVKNFNYRISGVLLESISLNKKMIIPKYNDLKHFLTYNKKSILGFLDIDDFKKILKNLSKEPEKVDYKDIKEIYSVENMKKDILKILND